MSKTLASFHHRENGNLPTWIASQRWIEIFTRNEVSKTGKRPVCAHPPPSPHTHTRLWKHVRSRSTLNYVHYRVPGDVVPSGGPVCRRYGGAEMLEKQGERRVMTGGGSGVGGGDDIGSFCYGTSLTILFIEWNWGRFLSFEMFDYVKRLGSCHVGEMFG